MHTNRTYTVDQLCHVQYARALDLTQHDVDLVRQADELHTELWHRDENESREFADTLGLSSWDLHTTTEKANAIRAGVRSLTC